MKRQLAKSLQFIGVQITNLTNANGICNNKNDR